MGTIFQICCDIIRALSNFWGITYEEMNTYLFIYAQPILSILSFVTTISIITSKLLKKVSMLNLFNLVLFGMGGLVYTITTFVVWKRYSVLSAHDTCILAYKDLETLGKMTGMGYIGINFFLFIILFSLVFGLNIISAFLLKYYVKVN